MKSRKIRKSWKLEAMKNIIVLIEPQVETYHPHWKLANLYMNRFSIDEDAAFELLGVYYLQKYSDDMVNEARLEKGWNMIHDLCYMNYQLNSHSKRFFRKVRFWNHKCCNC